MIEAYAAATVMRKFFRFTTAQADTDAEYLAFPRDVLSGVKDDTVTALLSPSDSAAVNTTIFSSQSTLNCHEMLGAALEAPASRSGMLRTTAAVLSSPQNLRPSPLASLQASPQVDLQVGLQVVPQEHQGVMGLTDAEFFAGHFLTIMIICCLESTSVMGLLYYSKENALAWAHDMDPSLVAFSFFMFAAGFSFEIIMLTWIFPKGWIAVIGAFLLWTVVPSDVTEAADPQSLAGYILLPKFAKLAAGFFPSSGLSSVLRILSITRDYESTHHYLWTLCIR
ncbi:hypothetical protein V5799_004685 [Amblyomma americanum]|uniref:Uncharacterized protein n=1 Tax=Amblyomma americanum TaxID=6943 RepID=A0AAQ4D5E4_AMBAM